MGSNIVVLEQCQVAPSPHGGAAKKLLPLLDFDVIFLRFPLVQLVLFYNVDCSKLDFLETIVPNLKKSLSIVLKHFYPLAGNTIIPLSSGTGPVCRCVVGDFVSLTIAQSDADFVDLTGNHCRDADHFCDLVPKLPQPTYLSDSIRFRLAVFQVTLFPDQVGVCVGVTIHHSIADGATVLRFLQAWSSISKFKGDDSHLLADGLVSVDTLTPPTHNVRAMFVLSHDQIQQLKKFVLNKIGKNVSSFVMICAYLWTCSIKSVGPDEVGDDEPQYLACPGDCRSRVANLLVESTHGRLRGKQGIVEAAVAIGNAIHKTFPGENGVVDFSGYQKPRKLNRRRVLVIAMGQE